MSTEDSMIASVKHWLDKTIIGFNFCPFAKREFDAGKIHYEVVDDSNPEEQLHAIVNEFHRLDKHPEIETTLVILPLGLESYFGYLDFLDIANDLLTDEGYEGIYQLASFHPDYCFADVKQDDPSNYTNRSPLPVIHIIREQSLEKVIAHHPDPEGIPDRNIALAKETGQEVFEEILQQSQQLNKGSTNSD